MAGRRRALLLVDGEHHPPVLRAAIEGLADRGIEPLAAVVAGGGEKLQDPSQAPELPVPATVPPSAEAALPALLAEHRPDVVLDMSGEPVVTPTRRLRLAAVTLAAGVAYEAPGVGWRPPPQPEVTSRPALAVVATGKRTGKTATCGALVRHARDAGRTPVVVAMGRGGPPEPVVVRTGADLSPAALLEVVAGGGHAASDFYEDAVTTGATTVGCFRVGDGPAGEVGHTNVPAGIARAEQEPGDLLVLEGSGAALPPARADATVLIVPATVAPGDLAAALPLRLLLADVVLVTFAGGRDPERLAAVRDAVRDELERLPADGRPRGGDPPRVVPTRFVPRPLGAIADRRVLLVTTAGAAATDRMARRLEERHGARVVATSTALADRPRLRGDLGAAPDHDVALVELKAAAVDVVARHAAEAGREVVFLDHALESLEGQPPVPEAFDHVLDLADRRHGAGG